MAVCELCSSCFFFKEASSEESYRMTELVDKYCNDNFRTCIRFRISMLYGSDSVPTYIYPNDFTGNQHDLPVAV